MRIARRLAAALLLAPAIAHAQSPALRVWSRGAWRTWWRADQAPAAWASPSPVVRQALAWRVAAPGISWAELRLSGSGEAWRVRAIVVRLDPKRVRLHVVDAAGGDGNGRWTIDSAPPRAVVAFNAGQFVGGSPWGWVRASGRDHYSPEAAPLALALAFDTAGAPRWFGMSELGARNDFPLTDAIQSYPMLLRRGEVPAPLREPNSGVDLEHRDARLAIGETRAGELLVVLTRFDAMGESLGAIPFGLTTPEAAALMGALGCEDAVALDGGISAQLLVRETTQPVPAVHAWHGLRKVPVGIYVESR